MWVTGSSVKLAVQNCYSYSPSLCTFCLCDNSIDLCKAIKYLSVCIQVAVKFFSLMLNNPNKRAFYAAVTLFLCIALVLVRLHY